MTFHIRNKCNKSRSNRWYKDRSDRGNGNMCGAPETTFDQSWADRKRSATYEHPEFGLMTLCVKCKAVRDKS